MFFSDPYVLITPHNITVLTGDIVVLECLLFNVEHIKNMKFVWSKNLEYLASQSNILAFEVHHVRDSGHYTCTVSNDQLEIQSVNPAVVNVQGENNKHVAYWINVLYLKNVLYMHTLGLKLLSIVNGAICPFQII